MSKSPKNTTKAASVTKLLSRDRGATIAEMAKATGWKEHSVRAFLTGIRKSATLIKEQRSGGETAYHIGLSRPTPDAKVEVLAS
jgi:hypothetical protein